MSQVIRIPDTIYNRLGRQAQGFETPANVIERILDQPTEQPVTVQIPSSYGVNSRDIVKTIPIHQIEPSLLREAENTLKQDVGKVDEGKFFPRIEYFEKQKESSLPFLDINLNEDNNLVILDLYELYKNNTIPKGEKEI